MLDSIINSFKQFPQIHFLWKVDKDTIKNISKLPNVHAFEWLQQPAILGNPTERLVKWVEFAAEFGDLPELNLPGEKEMNWFVYYSLDVILFSIIVLAILFWVTFKCFKWILFSTINLV
uniref:glucuronosyltransferase n=1 Tax=Meloidogyne enterolobii TaxID=390850 RepID=A0A6V7YBG3_MELEN|nr:unnamed protein product [Meloidogyne enterolobii]